MAELTNQECFRSARQCETNMMIPNINMTHGNPMNTQVQKTFLLSISDIQPNTDAYQTAVNANSKYAWAETLIAIFLNERILNDFPQSPRFSADSVKNQVPQFIASHGETRHNGIMVAGVAHFRTNVVTGGLCNGLPRPHHSSFVIPLNAPDAIPWRRYLVRKTAQNN